ncbi:MAG: glycosyltransferase family 9 protein [Ignavibacteriaceae bacterium]|nr:glycosyltransferase family 9 protein [Ignavibacteriaceae bacterium]
MLKNKLDKKRILIIRQDRIGDTVVTTGMPREIKNNSPGSFIAVLVREQTKPVYENNPFVDQILTLPKEYTSGTLAKLLKQYNFDVALLLLPDKIICYALFRAGIKKRIMTGIRPYSIITFTHSVSRNKYSERRKEGDYCMDLVRYLGIQTEDFTAKIYLNNHEEKIVESEKEKNKQDGRIFIGIHTTSGNSAPNLSHIEYRKLAELLVETKKFRVKITDLQVPEPVKQIPGVEYVILPESLRESIVNYAKLDVLVSNSTGPMHITAALGVKTVSVFCPLPACEPALWGPTGNDPLFILPEENFCGTVCSGDPKSCDFSGKGGISAQKVFNKIMEIYSK